MAGLKGLRPTPPNRFLPARLANAAAPSPSHQGAWAGSARPSSTALTRPLPSPSHDSPNRLCCVGLGCPDSRRARASLPRKPRLHSSTWSSTPGPWNQNSRRAPGSSAISTWRSAGRGSRSGLAAFIEASLGIGQPLTCRGQRLGGDGLWIGGQAALQTLQVGAGIGQFGLQRALFGGDGALVDALQIGSRLAAGLLGGVQGFARLFQCLAQGWQARFVGAFALRLEQFAAGQCQAYLGLLEIGQAFRQFDRCRRFG